MKILLIPLLIILLCCPVLEAQNIFNRKKATQEAQQTELRERQERMADSLQVLSRETRQILLDVRVLLDSHATLRASVDSSRVETRANREKHATLEEKYRQLLQHQTNLEKSLRSLSRETGGNASRIRSLAGDNAAFRLSVDSLQGECRKLDELRQADRLDFSREIRNTNESLVSGRAALDNRTIWGIGLVVVVLLVLFLVFYRLAGRIRTETSSIARVREAQQVLQAAQQRMQEESVTLDNKLLELIEKQMRNVQSEPSAAETDHSLALKVADEIVRIEMNLARMDTSVKGYKQLAKAIQRIKDNFNAKGYEIVEMLGKPYMAGMKAAVTFVTDESLQEGQQVITKIIKPQINYRQQMIQAAQIEVSQPE